jgi:hypothetical protein
MLSVEELITQYEAYTDEELYEVLVQIEGYSPEAKQALATVIDQREGREALIQRLHRQAAMEKERTRIVAEIDALGKKGVDKSFIGATIQSEVLTRPELDALIDQAYHRTTLDMADRKIKPRTIIGGLVGLVIASLIGSIVCDLLLNWAPERLPLIVIALLFVGLSLGCGVVIKLCTGQSHKNKFVIGATILAMVLSFGLSGVTLRWIMILVVNARR